MAVFAIIIVRSETLAAAIPERFPEALSVRDGVWLVSHKGTAKTISDELDITDGTAGTAVILQVSGYFGRANPNIWAWIKENWGAASG